MKSVGIQCLLIIIISTMQIKIPFIYINVMHWFSYFRHYHTRWNIQESGKLLTAPSTKLQNIFSITLTYHFNTFLDHSWTLHMIAVLLFFLKKRAEYCWDFHKILHFFQNQKNCWCHISAIVLDLLWDQFCLSKFWMGGEVQSAFSFIIVTVHK